MFPWFTSDGHLMVKPKCVKLNRMGSMGRLGGQNLWSEPLDPLDPYAKVPREVKHVCIF